MNCICGKEIVLRVMRITVNRKRGIAHYLEHRDGTAPCVKGKWSCAALKPYPKNEDDHEWRRLMRRFDAAVALDKEAKGE